MDYIVTALSGANVRRRPSKDAEILYTLGYNLHVEIDESVTNEGAVWRHSPEHNGWIRSDLLDRYANSAEPMPVIVTDDPTDARYSLGYTAGWNARGEADAKAKRTDPITRDWDTPEENAAWRGL